MSMRIEDTESGKEAEFIVLDFIKSTPNASVADIATLINDVGADLNYLATVLNVDPVIARQAYSEVISTAPPIQEVIKKQIDSNPVVPPTRPLDQVIDPSGPAFSQEEIDNVVGQLTRGDKTPSEIAQQYGVSEDFVNTNLQIVQEQAFQDLNSGAKTPEQVASQYNLSNEFVVSNLARVNQERNIAPDIVPPVNDDSERPILPSVPDAQLPVGLAAAEQAALGGAGTATGLLGATAGSAGRELTAGTLGGIGALRGGIGQARQDIIQGTQTGIGALQQALGGARSDIQSGFQRAEGMFDPYSQAGGQALQQQMALSGALGPEAFQQAYQESPQMRFLQEQGERAALRTAGARGGLGGGRVMQELARYGTGLASQDLQNQIANLQSLSAQGMSARGSAANIATGGAQQLANLGVLGGTSGLQAATQQGTQLANLAQQLGVSEADLRTSLGAGRSNIALGIGTRAADLAAQTGLNVAGMRTRAGEQLAGQFGTTASQMGGLQQGMGAGTAQMIGGQTDLVSRLQQAAAQGDAAAQTELASMQAQGYSNIGAQLAGVPQSSTFVPQSPILGALGGATVGARLGEMFPQQQQVQAPVFNSQPYVAPTQPAAYMTPTQQAPFVNLQTGSAFT